MVKALIVDKLPIFLATLIYVILAIFIFGNILDWYNDFLWLDDLSHFLGGVWVAGLFIYLMRRWRVAAIIECRFWLQLLLGLGFVSLVAVFWEFFEFIGDWYIEKPFLQLSLPDTLSDLFFALIGSLLFFVIYFIFQCWSKSTNSIKRSKF